MKIRTQIVAVLVLLAVALLPVLGMAQAEEPDFKMEGPIPCERMTVDTVEVSHAGDKLNLMIQYTLNETLTDEDKEALELMNFNIMPDAESTEFPEGFLSGSVAAVNESQGFEIVAGGSYIQTDEWEGFDKLPETLYLRPYYKLLGVWGDVIVIDTVEGKVIEAA